MRLSDLQPTSFRGVRALCPHDVTEEGRNTILHHYPDAAHRYAEDNGYSPPKFDMTFVLHGAGLPGKVRALRNALNTPGPGTLQHPHYGAQFCAVAGPYRVRREDQDSGVVIIEATFVVTGPPLFPGRVSGIAAVVTGLAATAVTQLFTAFAARFAPPRSGASRAVLGNAVADVAATLSATFGAGEAAARIARDAGALVAQPTRLATLLTGAFRAPFEDAGIAAPVLVRGMDAVGEFALTLSAEAAGIVPSTYDLALRQASLAELADAVRAAAFAGQADAMAGRDYATAEEVAADEARLGEAFVEIQAGGLPGADHQRLAQIHVAASEVLRDREVRLPRLTDIDVVEFPVSVLAYQLYDATDNLAALVANNPLANPVLYHGPARVLVSQE